MSRSVDLFIDSSLPIEALAEHLRARTGAQVVSTADPARWRMSDGSLTADLYEHAYVDDGELWLSRYRYVLSTHMPDGVGLLDSSEVLGLRHLAQVLHAPPELSVLLVLDLQYRLPPAGGAGAGAAVGGPRAGWGPAASVAAGPESRPPAGSPAGGEPA
ncbi:MAG: hypothetical protein J2P58_13140 [Acidimicrobiaceae bacterium]|nr:hypothetical protein [Acidimicrobiaceae bacterium]